MSDTKKISLELSIEGLSNEAAELAKLETYLKNLNEAKKKFFEKANSKGIISNQDQLTLAAYDRSIKETSSSIKGLKKVIDSAPDSLNRMRQRLIEMKNEYANASEAARNKMAPAINKLNDEVSKAEKAIGVHSRGVGNYKGGIMDAAKELLGFAGITAVAATALNQLKTSFFETELGARTMKRWGEGMRTFFQSVLGGADAAGAVRNAAVAMDVAKKMDELRKGDRQDLIEIAKLEGELNQLKIQAADVTKTTTEQLALQNQVSQKENDILQFKIKDKQEELDILNQLIAVRPEDTKLLDQQAQLQAEIINLQNDQSVRIAAKQAALREKEMKERDAMIKKEEEDAEKLRTVREKSGVDEFKRLEESYNAKEALKKKEADMLADFMQKTEQANEEGRERRRQKDQEDIEDAEKKAKAIESIEQAHADAKFNIAASFTNLIAGIAGKNKVLQKASLVADKGLAVAEIILKTRMANTALRANAALIPFPANIAALAIAQAAIIKNNIAAGIDIAAVTAATITGLAGFYKGGKINRGVPIYIPGSKDNLLIAANNKEAVVNERQIAALGGTRAMKAAGVPGFAEGGAIGNMPYINPAIPPAVGSSIDYERMAEIMKNSIEVTLNTHKVISAIREVEVAATHQRI